MPQKKNGNKSPCDDKAGKNQAPIGEQQNKDQPQKPKATEQPKKQEQKTKDKK